MLRNKARVVKARWAEKEEVASWGGLALVGRLAHRTRLWSDCRKLMPSRTRTDAGYDSTAVVSAMIHGLLSGSRGTYAAEPLREDRALRRLVGLAAGVPDAPPVVRAWGPCAAAAGVWGVARGRACAGARPGTSRPGGAGGGAAWRGAGPECPGPGRG